MRWRFGPQVLHLLWPGGAAEHLVAVRVAPEARYDVAGGFGLRDPELGHRPPVGRRVCCFLLRVADATLMEGKVIRVAEGEPEDGTCPHSPLLLLWWNSITSSTKTVDKPPSKAADPPHRTRLEAATKYSSPDTFSMPAGVPSKCLPFVEVSGEGRRMPVRPGRPLRPLLPSMTITRPAPAAAGVPRCRRFQHHHRPGAQYRPYPVLARRGHHYRRPSPRSDRRRTLPAPPCHGRPSSRRLRGVHPSLLSLGRVLGLGCNYKHKGRFDATLNRP